MCSGGGESKAPEPINKEAVKLKKDRDLRDRITSSSSEVGATRSLVGQSLSQTGKFF